MNTSRDDYTCFYGFRNYIDANRAIDEACQGIEACNEIYNEYHGKYAELFASFTRGLCIDFHGQSHHQNSTEFGYRIDKSVLDEARANDDNLQVNKTSIDALLGEYASSKSGRLKV